MTEWQPIETAPKDGTPILIWIRDRLYEAMWCEHRFKPSSYIGEDADEDGWWGIRWAEIDSYGVSPDEMPTHWMPLPNPPAHPTPSKDTNE